MDLETLQAIDALAASFLRRIADAVRPVVREEVAAALDRTAAAEAEVPHSSTWWAAKLGCTASSLVKRAKRGTLAHTRRGTRYYFTQAEIEGRERR